MYDIKEESTEEALDECVLLGKSHNDEVLDSVYNPNKSLLSIILNAGMLSIVTARQNGVMVGYWLNVVTEDFLSSTIMAREGAFFVHPDARGSSVFFRMLKLSEKIAKSKGAICQLIMFEEGYDNGFAPRLGYKPVEHVYKKNLGDINGSSN